MVFTILPAFGGVSVLAVSSGSVIDMSDENPPASGDGWEYNGERYLILDGADVTVTGDNSVYSRFCDKSDNSGQMTFNEFMHKYTDDGADAKNAQRWWDPDNIFLGFNNKVLIYMNAKMVKQFDSFDIYKIVDEPHRDVVGVE